MLKQPTRSELEAMTKPQLIDLIELLFSKLNEMEKRIQELESKLNVKATSKNSSVSPSSDLSRKRKKGNESNTYGPPKNHKGISRKISEKPDVIMPIKLEKCPRTGDKIQSKSQSFKRHQILELEPAKVIVIEIQRQTTTGPDGKTVVAPNPVGVKKFSRIGPNLKAHISYLRFFLNTPWSGIWKYLKDLAGLKIGIGTLKNIFSELKHAVTDDYNKLKDEIASSPAVGCDETGIHVNGKNWWIHVVRNADTTVFSANKSRDHSVIQDILGKDFSGWLISDFWGGYSSKFYPDAKFQKCLAHLLRDIERVIEIEKANSSRWAQQLQDLFMDAIILKKFFRPETEHYKNECLEKENRLESLLAEVSPTKSSATLKKRLKKYQHHLLNFLYNDDLPFDNNGSERDIRMIVTCRKISGAYKTEDGIDTLAIVKSLLATYSKRGKEFIQKLREAFGVLQLDSG